MSGAGHDMPRGCPTPHLYLVAATERTGPRVEPQRSVHRLELGYGLAPPDHRSWTFATVSMRSRPASNRSKLRRRDPVAGADHGRFRSPARFLIRSGGCCSFLSSRRSALRMAARSLAVTSVAARAFQSEAEKSDERSPSATGCQHPRVCSSPAVSCRTRPALESTWARERNAGGSGV